MIFNIDTTSSVPIYAQIIEQVKHAIAAGVLVEGDSLPSLRETAARLRVNPLTVAKAYRELEAIGIVSTEHGRGTFINSQSEKLGESYRHEALAQAVSRMLVDAYYLGATAEEVRDALEKALDSYSSGARVRMEITEANDD